MLSMIKTRPDIIFFIGVTTYFIKNPSYIHIKVVKIILYYFQNFIDYNIIYGSIEKKFSIEGYSNSNWVRDKKS